MALARCSMATLLNNNNGSSGQLLNELPIHVGILTPSKIETVTGRLLSSTEFVETIIGPMQHRK